MLVSYVLGFLLILTTAAMDCEIQCPNGTLLMCNTENGLGQCAIQLQENNNSLVLTENLTYYYYEPIYDAYLRMDLAFCGQDLPGVDNVLFFKIQSQENDYMPLSSSKRVTFGTTSQCQQYYVQGISLGILPNGSRKKVFMAMGLSAVATENMLIIIQSKEANYSPLMYMIFMISLVVGGLMTISFILFYIKRRCFSHSRQTETTDRIRDTDHIEDFMPKKKMIELTEVQGVNCSVCLSDIGKDELVRKTPCQHYFHVLCLQDWIKKALNCPNCRFDFTKENLEKTKKQQKKTLGFWLRKKNKDTLVEQVA